MRRKHPLLLLLAFVMAMTGALFGAEPARGWSKAQSGPLTLYYRGPDQRKAATLLRDEAVLLKVLQEFFPMSPDRLTPLEIYYIADLRRTKSGADSWADSLSAPVERPIRKFESALDAEDTGKATVENPPTGLDYFRLPGRDIMVIAPRADMPRINSSLVAWYLAHWDRKLPVWIETAMEAEFGSLSIDENEVAFGPSHLAAGGAAYSAVSGYGPAATSGGRSSVGFDPSISVSAEMAPIEAMLAVKDPANPGEEYEKNVQPFPAHAALMGHYLLNQPRPNRGESIRRYIELAASGTMTAEQELRGAFEIDSKQLQKRVRSYIATGGLSVGGRTQSLPATTQTAMTAISEGETNGINLTLLLAVGKPAQARKLALKVDPAGKDWFTLAMLAEANMAEKKFAEAAQNVAKAIALSPGQGWLYLLAAKSELGIELESKQTESVRADSGRRAANSFRQAITLDPRSRRAVQLYASEAASFPEVTPEDLQLLLRCADHYRDDPMILAGVAMVQSRLERHADAAKVIKWLLARHDLEPPFRQFLEQAARREYLPDALDEINALAELERRDEAEKRFEILLNDPQVAEMRPQLEKQRPVVMWTLLWTETVAKARRGEMHQVRTNLENLIATAPTPAHRAQAKQVLDNLPAEKQ